MNDASGPDRAPVRLFGRQRERQLLLHLLDEARQGRAGGGILWGVAGIGKTALLRWLAAEATEALVLRTSGDEWSPPFTAVRRLVAALPELDRTTHRWFGTADALDHELATSSPSAALRRPDAVGGLAADIAEALVARARRRLLLVTVDDAQHLGPASAGVLEQVLLELDDAAGRHPLYLLTAVAADPSVAAGRLPHLLARLGSVRSLSLAGLGEHDVADMLAAALPSTRGRPLPPGIVRDVLDTTSGVPLLVEGEIDRRTLGDGPAAGPVAPDVRVHSIADALSLRLDKLDRTAVEVLRAAAMLAEPWRLDELAAVLDLGPGDLASSVSQAVDVGCVDRDEDGFRLSHPVLRKQLLAPLNRAERARWHAGIADRLAGGAARPESPDALLRRADHLVRAGSHTADRDAAAAADTIRRAGEAALRMGAWHDASRLLAGAVRMLPVGAASPEELIAEHLAAGTAAWLDHDVESGEAALGAALELARKVGDGVHQLDAAIRLTLLRIQEQPLRLGARPEVGELEAALVAVSRDDDAGRRGGPGRDADDRLVALALQVEGRGVLAEALFASGESERALDLVETARVQASQVEPQPRLTLPFARLTFAEGLHHLARLDLAAAESCFREGAYRLGDVYGTTVGAPDVDAADPLMALTLRSRIALVTLMTGRVEQAVGELTEIYEEATRRRFWGEAGFAAAQLAQAGVLAGEADAGDVVERARRLLLRSGHTYTATVLAPAASALTAQRRGLAATAADGEVSALTGRPSSAVALLCAIEANDVAAVRSRLATASWRNGPVGPPTLANLPVLVALVEAGDILGQPEQVVSAGEALDEAADAGVEVVLTWPTTIARAQAIVARHRGELRRARHHTAAALGLVERSGLEAERAKVLVELARLEVAATGRPQPAQALLDEAAKVFDACSLLGWVGRTEAVARELGLAAVQRPSRVVADRTILTEDIVGSTTVNSRVGDIMYLELLRTHDRIVRARLYELGGEEIKHTGDGVNAVFSDAGAAARCALALQADFAAWARAQGDVALQVRCGLARGALIPTGRDYHGLVQSEAARLCSEAEPGQVLASAAVARAVDRPDVVARSLGRRQLRGMPGESEIFTIGPG